MESIIIVLTIVALAGYVGALGATKRAVGVVVSGVDTASIMADKELKMIEDEHDLSITKRQAKLDARLAKLTASKEPSA